jgi:hypothetical protein
MNNLRTGLIIYILINLLEISIVPEHEGEKYEIIFNKVSTKLSSNNLL